MLRQNKGRKLIVLAQAEGFEPEILEGALNTLNIIKYISIDCGFERYGNSTFAQVSDFLIKHEFHLLDFNSNRHSMLFCNKRILQVKHCFRKYTEKVENLYLKNTDKVFS